MYPLASLPENPPQAKSQARQNGPDMSRQGQAVTAAAPTSPKLSVMLRHDPEPERSSNSETSETQAREECRARSDARNSEISEAASWKPWSFHPCFVMGPIVVIHIIQISLISWVLSKYKAGDTAFFVYGDRASAYFAWRFLPTMSAVLLGFLWGIVDADVRLDYGSLTSLVTPLVALSRHHYCVGLSSTIYLLAFAVLPTAHDNMWDVDYKYDVYQFKTEVNPTVMYAVLGLTLSMVVLSAILLWVLRTRRCGLAADPAGLSGLASLIYESNILPIFRDIPVYQSQAYIDRKLLNHRFQLYQTLVTPVAGSPPVLVTRISSHVDWESGTNTATVNSPRQLNITFQHSRWEAHPWVLWGRFHVLSELPFLGLSIPLIVAQYQAQSSSKIWSPRVIRTLAMFLTSMTTALWTATDEGIRLMEPWRQLACDNPSISRTDAVIADYDSMDPVSRIFLGAPMVAGISLGSLTAQVFVILYPALLDSIWKMAYSSPYSIVPKTLQVSIMVLGYVSIPIGIMNIIIWLSLFSRKSPIVPRKPSTLSSKILYICQSQKLLDDVHRAVARTAGQRAENIRKLKNQYRFGWFSVGGERRQLQLGVEQEPLELPYSYGHIISS